MGTSVISALGPPPSPKSIRIRDYVYRGRDHILNQCPLTRAGTTYYFSDTNGDSGDTGLSKALAKATVADAQTIHDAWSEDADGLVLLFMEGDTFASATGLNITKDNVTVGSYFDDAGGKGGGDAAKPIIMAYTEEYLDASNPWTTVSGNHKKLTEASTIAHIREKADRLNPYAEQTNATDVTNTTRSWWYDTGLTELHVNPGSDPNAIDFEAVVAHNDSGIEVSGDGCRVNNIRTDGSAAGGTDNDHEYGIKVSGSGTNVCAATNCEAYYIGVDGHCIGHHGGAGAASGGTVLFMDCKGGFPLVNDTGENVFNSYVGSGGQEAIFWNCEATYGTVPAGTGTHTPTGRSILVHTDGDPGDEPALAIAWNCKVKAGTYSALNGVKLSDGFAVTRANEFNECRMFNIGETIEETDGVGDNFEIAPEGQANIDCTWVLKPTDQAAGALALASSSNNQQGVGINCTLNADITNQAVQLSLFSDLNAATATLNLYHCHIHARCGSAQKEWHLDRRTRQDSTDTDCPTSDLANCIISVSGGGNSLTTVGWNDDAARMRNIAVTVDGFTDGANNRRYSNAANLVEVTVDQVPIGLQPTPGHPLYRAGEASGVEYDKDWRRRDVTSPSIGPIEHEIDVGGQGGVYFSGDAGGGRNRLLVRQVGIGRIR